MDTRALISEQRSNIVWLVICAVVTAAERWLRMNGWLQGDYILYSVTLFVLLFSIRLLFVGIAFFKRGAPVTEQNVESMIQKWVDSLGVGIRRVRTPPELAHFMFDIELGSPPEQPVKVSVVRLKQRPGYLKVRSGVNVVKSRDALMALPDQGAAIAAEMRIALNSIGMAYADLGVPLQRFHVFHWVPITRELSEFDFATALEKTANSTVLAAEILELRLKQQAGPQVT